MSQFEKHRDKTPPNSKQTTAVTVAPPVVTTSSASSANTANSANSASNPTRVQRLPPSLGTDFFSNAELAIKAKNLQDSVEQTYASSNSTSNHLQDSSKNPPTAHLPKATTADLADDFSAEFAADLAADYAPDCTADQDAQDDEYEELFADLRELGLEVVDLGYREMEDFEDFEDFKDFENFEDFKDFEEPSFPSTLPSISNTSPSLSISPPSLSSSSPSLFRTWSGLPSTQPSFSSPLPSLSGPSPSLSYTLASLRDTSGSSRTPARPDTSLLKSSQLLVEQAQNQSTKTSASFMKPTTGPWQRQSPHLLRHPEWYTVAREPSTTKICKAALKLNERTKQTQTRLALTQALDPAPQALPLRVPVVGSTPNQPKEKFRIDTSIGSKRILLRPIVASDAQAYYRYSKVPGVFEPAGLEHHRSMHEASSALTYMIMHKYALAISLRPLDVPFVLSEEQAQAVSQLGLEVRQVANSELAQLKPYKLEPGEFAQFIHHLTKLKQNKLEQNKPEQNQLNTAGKTAAVTTADKTAATTNTDRTDATSATEKVETEVLSAEAEASRTEVSTRADAPTSQPAANTSASWYEKFVDALEHGIATYCTNPVRSCIHKLTASYRSSTDVIRDTLTQKAENVKDNLSKTAESVKEEITKRVEPVKEEISKRVEPVKQEITHAVETSKQEISSRVETAKQGISNRVESAKQEITTRVESAKQELTNRVEQAKQEITTRVESVRDTVHDKITDIFPPEPNDDEAESAEGLSYSDFPPSLQDSNPAASSQSVDAKNPPVPAADSATGHANNQHKLRQQQAQTKLVWVEHPQAGDMIGSISIREPDYGLAEYWYEVEVLPPATTRLTANADQNPKNQSCLALLPVYRTIAPELDEVASLPTQAPPTLELIQDLQTSLQTHHPIPELNSWSSWLANQLEADEVISLHMSALYCGTHAASQTFSSNLPNPTPTPTLGPAAQAELADFTARLQAYADAYGFVRVRKLKLRACVSHHNTGVTIGYSMAKEHWGKNYMPEVANAMIDHLFTERGFTYILCDAYATNLPSLSVISKSNFSYLAACVKTDGWYVPQVGLVFVLTKQRWQELRQA